MKKKFAFTLVEILIAITVFAIGILAVLRILTWNLSIMDHTDMKLQSTVLAKEWLELLYNLRDSNLEKKLQWNCVLNQGIYDWEDTVWGAGYQGHTEEDICVGYFGSEDKLLQLAFHENNYLYQKISDSRSNFDDLFEENQLCLFSWNNMVWYAYCSWSPSSGIEKTGSFFARYLSFKWVSADWLNLPNDKILKVESHVLYKKWYRTGDIVFESFIWNY